MLSPRAAKTQQPRLTELTSPRDPAADSRSPQDLQPPSLWLPCKLGFLGYSRWFVSVLKKPYALCSLPWSQREVTYAKKITAENWRRTERLRLKSQRMRTAGLNISNGTVPTYMALLTSPRHALQ